MTLIKLLQVASGRAGRLAPVGLLGSRAEVKMRLSMIANHRRNSRLSTALFAALALVLSSLFLTNAEADNHQADLASERTRVDQGQSVRATLAKQGGRVWFEGVKPLADYSGTENNSYLSAMQMTLATLGESHRYTDLMGISGAAFRFQIYEPDWCPSAQCAVLGFNCAAPLVEACGFSLTTWQIPEEEKHNSEIMHQARAAIVETIDAGYPVPAVNLIGEFNWELDWGVIVGYEDSGEVFLAYAPEHMAGAELVRVSECPLVFDLLRRQKEAPERRESLIQSLRIASNVAHADSFSYYTSGFDAYAAWIEGLQDDSRFAQLDREQLEHYLQSNAFNYHRLRNDRLSAAGYLSSIAGEFSGELAGQLRAAAGYYQRIAERLAAGQEYAPFAAELAGSAWTQQLRDKQAAVLQEVLSLEREAIAAVETALALAEANSPERVQR
jgi:hypothetical protein